MEFFCPFALVVLTIGGISQTRQEPTRGFLHNDSGMRSLKSSTGEKFEKRFISQSIQHHRGSIDLAERALKLHLTHEVKSLCYATIRRDKTEIQELQSLLKRWYRIQPIASEERLIRDDMASQMRMPIATQATYINLALGHEEEEVQMGQFVASRSVHQELAALADKMVVASKKDILFLLSVLRRRTT